MSYNGSGAFSLSDTIANGTPNDADELQAILDDIATGLSNAVCVDGQSTMTGVLKNSNGSAAAPSITFGSDTNSGFYRKAADDIGVAVGGALVANFDTSGLTFASNKALGGSNIVVTANITDNAVTLAKLATQADGTILANVSGGAAVPTAATITSVIDKVYSTQGGLLYRGAASWAGLGAGTSGQYLKTQGAGANPIWADVLPSQSGNAGKVLQSDGSSTSWSGDASVRVRCTVTVSGTTPSVQAGSVNVSGVSRSSTGVYVVTFSSALASANYQVMVHGHAAGTYPVRLGVVQSEKTTTQCTIRCYDYGISPVGVEAVSIDLVIYGGF